MNSRAKTALFIVIFLLIQLSPWALMVASVSLIANGELENLGDSLNGLAYTEYLSFVSNDQGGYTLIGVRRTTEKRI